MLRWGGSPGANGDGPIHLFANRRWRNRQGSGQQGASENRRWQAHALKPLDLPRTSWLIPAYSLVMQRSRMLLLSVIVLGGAILLLARLSGRQDTTVASSENGTGNPDATEALGGEATSAVIQGRGEGVEEAQESTRAEAPLPALAGLVLSEDGHSVAGATLSWTALDQNDLEWEPAWHDEDWGFLDRPTVWSTSDAEGRFIFDEDSREGRHFGSLIWATHLGYEAGCLLLAPDKKLDDVDRTIRLRQSPGIVVYVQDKDGRPAPDTLVHQFGLTPAFALPENGGSFSEERARRYLWRTLETDSEGKARFGAFPGEQILVATREDQRSLPWRGPWSDTIVLRLVEGFTVEGRITLPDWTHLNYVGERRITIAAQRDNVWRSLATLRHVQDGPWGPVELPIANEAHYRIHLEGSPIIPVMVDFAAPAPGSRLSFDIQAELGHDVTIEAVDEEGKPVPTAEATVWWWEGGKRNFVRRRARPDGYINPWSMPAGTVYFVVEAPGYVTVVSEAFTLPLNVAVQFVLKRAGRLRGHCLHAGRPVEDFEVIVWRSGWELEKQTHAFHGRKDGAFELDTVPNGEVFVTASAEALVGGEPSLVRIGRDSQEEVTLELFDPLLGRGVVVDAETDEPIPAATIQTYIMGDWGRLEGFGIPVPVHPNGAFEIRAFVKGKNVVTVQAPGYADFVHTFFAEGDSPAELGRIGLLRPQALEIQLVVEGLPGTPVDFSSIVTSSDVDPILPQTAFSPEGRVRFDSQRPGPRMVTIDRPGYPWARLNLNLRSGEDWRFIHRVAGLKRLTVEVVPEPGETLEGVRAILVEYRNGQGVITTHGAALPSDGVVTLDGIDTGTVMVSVLDGTWETIAIGEGSFAGKDELHLTIPLGGAPYLFRVVDGKDLPVSGATIQVNDSQPSVLFLSGTT